MFLALLIPLLILAEDIPSPLPFESNYHQDFMKLSFYPPGVHVWDQGDTVPGWWSNMQYLRVTDGSIDIGGLHAFGAKKPHSLGGQVSIQHKRIVWGVSFLNRGEYDIRMLTIGLLFQQWRYGGTPHSGSRVEVDWMVLPVEHYDNSTWGVDGLPSEDWVRVHSARFNSPVSDGSEAVPLNGHEAQQLLQTDLYFDTLWKHNEILQIRFILSKIDGKSDGLALADFTLSSGSHHHSNFAYLIIIPVVVALLLIIGGGSFVLYHLWRRFRREEALLQDQPNYHTSGSTIDIVPFPTLNVLSDAASSPLSVKPDTTADMNPVLDYELHLLNTVSQVPLSDPSLEPNPSCSHDSCVTCGQTLE